MPWFATGLEKSSIRSSRRPIADLFSVSAAALRLASPSKGEVLASLLDSLIGVALNTLFSLTIDVSIDLGSCVNWLSSLMFPLTLFSKFVERGGC